MESDRMTGGNKAALFGNSDDGSSREGTTWHEDERQNRECAEWGYYYDEYGEEYEECERYEYITYYVCSTNLDFNYT